MRIPAHEKIAIMLARKLLPLLLLLLILPGTRAEAMLTAEGPEFLADLSDVPLAPGLVEVEAERLVFDKPEGRIVRAVATGKRPVAEIAGFYGATLPQLGWQVESGTAPPPDAAPGRRSPHAAADRLLFFRDAERLEIVMETVYETLVVRFSLEPRS